jgi:N-acetylglucosamine-6-phosphate deacetylase
MRFEGATGSSGGATSVAIGAEGRIAAVDDPSVDAGRAVDLSGLWIEPGFVDLQVNGGYGHLFTTDPERIWGVAARLPAHGVTAFLPTLVSASIDEAQAADAVLAAGPPEGWVGAEPIGLHLEGPALSKDFCGAHDPGRLVEPAPSLVDEWLGLGSLRLVTLAPELPGAAEAIQRLSGRGVAVALGHTAATTGEVRSAAAAGASMATHVFNAMAPFHHRDPGVVGAVLTDDRLAVGLIADGEHVAPEALALAWRAAGPDRIVLTGDVVAGLGAARPVDRTSDGGLAGGTTPFHRVRTIFMEAIGAESAIPSVTSANACRVTGLTDRGALDPGRWADIVLVDAAGKPEVTIVAGRVGYDPEGRVSSG